MTTLLRLTVCLLAVILRNQIGAAGRGPTAHETTLLANADRLSEDGGLR